MLRERMMNSSLIILKVGDFLPLLRWVWKSLQCAWLTSEWPLSDPWLTSECCVCHIDLSSRLPLCLLPWVNMSMEIIKRHKLVRRIPLFYVHQPHYHMVVFEISESNFPRGLCVWNPPLMIAEAIFKVFCDFCFFLLSLHCLWVLCFTIEKKKQVTLVTLLLSLCPEWKWSICVACE